MGQMKKLRQFVAVSIYVGRRVFTSVGRGVLMDEKNYDKLSQFLRTWLVDRKNYDNLSQFFRLVSQAIGSSPVNTRTSGGDETV